jgi:hypothetical protein
MLRTEVFQYLIVYFWLEALNKIILSVNKKGLLRMRDRGRKREWYPFPTADSKLILSSITNYAFGWSYMDETKRKEVQSSQWESTIPGGGSPRGQHVSVSPS